MAGVHRDMGRDGRQGRVGAVLRQSRGRDQKDGGEAAERAHAYSSACRLAAPEVRPGADAVTLIAPFVPVARTMIKA